MTVYTKLPISEDMQEIITLDTSNGNISRRGRPAKALAESDTKADAQSQLQRNHKWATDLATHFDALILVHDKGELVLDRDGVRRAVNLNNHDSYDSAKAALATTGY